MPSTDPLAVAVLGKAKTFRWLQINTDAALYKFAQGNQLGYPQTDEFEVIFNNTLYLAQVYNLGIVFAIKGDYENIRWIQKPDLL